MSILIRILVLLGSMGLIKRWIAKRNSFESRPAHEYILPMENIPQATRSADGRIQLMIPARDSAFSLFAGPAFDSIATEPLWQGEGSDISLDAPSTARQYFRVVWQDGNSIEFAERNIPGMGIENFRDLGGYPTKDGRTTAWNKVYRGASLTHVNSDQLQKLDALGIRLVCDMRSYDEIAEDPDQLPANSRTLHLPALNQNGRMKQLGYLFFDRRNLNKVMFDLYTRVMIDQNGNVFREIFEAIADSDNLPMIIHCAAGKDRTGLATALLLMTLGVPDKIIVADYSLSNASFDYFQRLSHKAVMPLARIGIGVTDIHALLVADPDIMQASIGHIYNKYGSAEAYLLNHTGLSRSDLEKARQNLLND